MGKKNYSIEDNIKKGKVLAAEIISKFEMKGAQIFYEIYDGYSPSEYFNNPKSNEIKAVSARIPATLDRIYLTNTEHMKLEGDLSSAEIHIFDRSIFIGRSSSRKFALGVKQLAKKYDYSIRSKP